MEYAAPHHDFRLGQWLVQPSLGRICRQDAIVHLRPLLMDLLLVLARHAGNVVPKETIIQAVWARRFLADSALTRLVTELRHALDDLTEQPRYIETIPKRGYRLVAPVTSGAGKSIVVLPFADLSAPEAEEYFGDGLAEEMSRALTRIHGLRVIARTSARAFKGKAVDVREIGRQLKAEFVLQGSIQRAAGRMRINLQLIETASGGYLWAEHFDSGEGHDFAFEDEIAREVAEALRVTLLTDGEARLQPRRAPDPRAHDLYLKGRHLWGKRTPQDIGEAGRCFQEVLLHDPSHALAYSALGECFCSSGFLGYLPPQIAFPRAKTAADRALQIEPALGEAHAVRGFATAVYDWKWAEAERSLARAVQLAPSCVQSRLWYSLLLASLGRFAEARAQIEHAWDLDPLSPFIRANVGSTLFLAGRFEDSLTHCLRAVEMDPHNVIANFHLGRACQALGRLGEAAEALERAAPHLPIAQATLGAVSARMGRRKRAEAILKALTPMPASGHAGWICLATVHAGLGNREQALDCFERSFEAREGFATLLGVDPSVDDFRGEPRFQALVRRLALPKKSA